MPTGPMATENGFVGSELSEERCQLTDKCAALQDTSWLDMYLSDVPHIVYQVDDPKKTKGAQHATLANKGNEAMAYLQFIIDYYDRLPASIAFIHAHR